MRARHSLCLSMLVLGLGMGTALHAGHTPEHSFPGDPPVARFEPDLDVFPQNFAVAQTADSVVYVGNAAGVLVFDGERWTLVRLPNGDLVRQLVWDGGRRVYVGGYNVFGWLERGADGVETFHDLTPRFQHFVGDGEFADIWDILVTPKGVMFRALRHLFLWDPASDAVAHWQHEGRFGAILMDGDDILLQFRGEGLKRYTGDGWQMVPGGAAFPEHVFQFLPMPDGGLLAMQRDGAWRVLRAGRVAAVTMPRGFPPGSDLANAIALADGTLAFTADAGVLHLWHPTRGMWRRVPIAKGRLSGIAPAQGGGLVLAGNDAVFHVEWPTPWTALPADTGLAATVHAARTWGERRLLLAGNGVNELEVRPDGTARTLPNQWTSHEAWDLLALDESRALLAESYALKLIEGQRATDLTGPTIYPRLLRVSRTRPERVLVGTEIGLAIMQREGRSFRVLLQPTHAAGLRISSMVETATGELWVGTERHGVHRLRLAPDGRSLLEDQRIDADAGIAYGVVPQAMVIDIDGHGLVASTDAGLFRWDGTRFVATELEGLAALRQPDEWLRLAVGPDGSTWAHGMRNVYRRPNGEAWRREDVSSVLVGALEEVGFDGPDTILTATNSVLRFDAATAKLAVPPVPLLMRSVEHVDASGARTPLAFDTEPPRYAEGAFSIALRFAMPELRRPKAARYRTRVLGYREEWSEYERSTTFTYSRLEPGEYTFEVQGQDSLGRETEVVRFGFIVEPVWYASRAALLLWTLLSLVLIAVGTRLVVRRRTRLLAADKSNLERMVGERTRDLEAANRMLETMAHLDGLTGIPNRRRLDDYLDQVWVQCGARERPLAILAIDVDRFKEYNDQHGHLAGDALLKKLAGLLTRSLRRTEDLAARYGGEEFLVVLPGAESDVALEVAESLRVRVASSSLGATISIGVASRVPRVGDSVADLVKAADVALYKAKETGRDRVVSDTSAG
jgi:diguanylate cyclase (GGDEF)-like protein